ncbi:UNVERIFIED_CONTAM: Photosystem I assembly factor PSA3, chloroplastic [Sesamum latifolium]|uniref:Photosystem I assembly factor PSA3, chloroplastic n=1 Tax=Sesamum latifolium TaxID=2727402 RepID=A0AAW2Y7E9_9LAMI
MVVLSSLQTNPYASHIYAISSNPIPSSLLYMTRRRRRRKPNNARYLLVRATYPTLQLHFRFANKIIGSLPIVGLIARIFSDEGGVGGDIVDFAEFRRRVGKKCSVNDSRAFFEFQERRGKPGDPLYVLLCCWLAAVGVGLLKSEEILEGVARLRISDDIEFEEENFIAMMNDSREKALEAIYVCCFGRDIIEEEDEELLSVILNAVFPTVGLAEIERIVKEKAKRVAEGTDEIKVPEPKPLLKAAVQLQMKDLQFLRAGNTE